MLGPAPAGDGVPRERLTAPYFCGDVPEMGRIAFDIEQPEGARIELATRTASDAGGTPGAWSRWSPPYAESPAMIASPREAWIQCRAVFHDAGPRRAVVRRLALGWPESIERVDMDALVPEPGEPLEVTVRFGEAMDACAPVMGELVLPGRDAKALTQGVWTSDMRSWRFEPVAVDCGEGVGEIVVGGARTPAGYPALHHGEVLVVGSGPLVDRLRELADWTMANPHNAIFVEGYNKRTLLGLYEITGEEGYIEDVRAWAQWLLEYQKPEGYWPTGYGDVYFADTGSALGLLINFYKFATADERKAIDTALERYAALLLVHGDSRGRPFVHEDGSLGVGYKAEKDGTITGDLNKPYTIATALTGAEIFGAMYYMTGNERYQEVAVRACDWLLDTMAPSGQIPYIIEDWNPGGKDKSWVWERWPYDTSAYAGEGFVAAWTYIDEPVFRKRLGERVKPHIEWLLRTQNDDGSWAKRGSGDQLRSHGVVNLLLWYHTEIERDPRIVTAIRQWYLLVLETPGYLRIPGEGIATSLAGRALVEIVKPGVDCYRWEE